MFFLFSYLLLTTVNIFILGEIWRFFEDFYREKHFCLQFPQPDCSE